MLSLFNGIYKPFGGINFLFNKKNGFFLSSVFFGTFIIISQHIAVAFANAQVGGIFGVERYFKFSNIIYYKKIGNHITLQFISIAYLPTGLGIELDDLIDYFFNSFFIKVQSALYFFIMFFSKFIKIIFYYFNGVFYGFSVIFFSLQLQQ